MVILVHDQNDKIKRVIYIIITRKDRQTDGDERGNDVNGSGTIIKCLLNDKCHIIHHPVGKTLAARKTFFFAGWERKGAIELFHPAMNCIV